MEPNTNLHLWILPLLPLIGSALNGLTGKNRGKGAIGAIASATVGLAFAYAVYLFFTAHYAEHAYTEYLAPWISAGPYHFDFRFYLDPLSMLMTLVVTGVGFLIHVYATSYMEHEDGYYRFFSYLNLFMFFMLTLVLAGNYLLLFVGWEGVGLCSYLLIGFYYTKKSAGDAGKKAFIVNRVGDFGFVLGMFLIVATAKSLDYETVFAAFHNNTAETGMGPITVICLLLLMGACGKSAQVPLYVWLPDAMEGPTPVSALIHAATMVTAGVYMVTRSSPLFVKAPQAMMAVAVIGAVTSIFAATIGLVQTDIKKVLAYSTVSQLGYMFLACGVGAFSAGIFHVMTHAFFKALLFLGAGSVITAMHHEQEMGAMGGLAKKIPVTFATMTVGCLAIAGFPGLSGFFSKDEILWQAYSHGHTLLWVVAIVTAALTAFYMFRLLFLTFFGEPRSDHARHAHESPARMTIPLVVLAILSIGGGWVGIPKVWGGGNQFEKFLEPSIGEMPAESKSPEPDGSAEKMFTLYAIIAGFAGIAGAYVGYVGRPKTGDQLAETFGGPYRVLLHKYYVDELYDTVIVRPTTWVSRAFLWHTVDNGVIDGTANGLADGARLGGGVFKRMQSGLIRSYAAWIVIGAVGVLLYMSLVWAK